MAFSYNEVTASAGQTVVAITFPFLDRAHVSVTVDKVATTAWTWLTDSTIKLNAALVGGEIVRVQRTTPASGVKATFVPGAFDYEDLNTSLKHLLYIVQEAYDNASVAVDAGNNAYSYLLQIEDLVDEANIIYGDMLEAGTTYNQNAAAALTALGNALAAALTDITTSRNGATTAITTARDAAVTAVNAARDAAITTINGKITLADNAATTATNKATAASTSAANALLSEQRVANAGVPVGQVVMQNGPVDAGYLRMGEGGTYSRTNYPDLAAWMDANGQTAFGLTPAQIAAGTLPDWRDYSARTAGGSLGPAVGAKQEDALQQHAHDAAFQTYVTSQTFTAGGGAVVLQGAGTGNLFAASITPASARIATETRVKSFGVRWQIKAFGAFVNQGTADLVAIQQATQALLSGAVRKDQSQTLTQSEKGVVAANIGLGYIRIGSRQVLSNSGGVGWFDLGGFRELILECHGVVNTVGGYPGLRVSNNNGTSFDSSTIYGRGQFYKDGNTLYADDTVTQNAFYITGGATQNLMDFEVRLSRFNQVLATRITSWSHYFAQSSNKDSFLHSHGYHAVGQALNALQLFFSSATFTGEAVLVGMPS